MARSPRRPESDRSPRTGLHKALAVTLAVGLGLLILVGLVFAIAYGSQQITGKATGLHDADETLRSATVIRAQLGLAVHMASVDDAVGTNSDDAIEHSLSETRAALTDLRTGTAELRTGGLLDQGRLESTLQGFATTAGELIALVEDRQLSASLSSSVDFDEQFNALVGELERIRDSLANSVEASDRLLGRIGDIARFLVAFLVPAGVIFTHRELVRRQQRQSDLEQRLDLERKLGQAREEFIANASHELRTPLTGILGLAHMLSEDPMLGGSDTASELLELIILESEDLTRMVEDLLTTARLDAGALHYSFEDVEICSLVNEVVEPVSKTQQLVSHTCEPGFVRVDELRLRQVLRNLLSNARKYGGPVVEVTGSVEGRTYAVAVRDNGSGIPEAIAESLFTRFVHQGADSAVKGSVGLGLSIVHALTQGMGGSVSYSRVDGMTEFLVRLPLAQEKATQRGPVLQGSDSSPASHIESAEALPTAGLRHA